MNTTMPTATSALPVSSASASQNKDTSTDLSLRDKITQKMSGYLVELGLMSEEDRSKDHVLANLLIDPNLINKMKEMKKEASEQGLEEKKEDIVTHFNWLGELLPWSRHDKIINQIKNQLDNNNVSNLNASALGLTSLPDHPSVLLSLNELDLSDNQFRTIPPVIAVLTNLTSLDLSNNDLGTLYILPTVRPSKEAEKKINTGEERDIASNWDLEQLPSNTPGMIQHTLSSLEKLKELNLSNNRELGTLDPKEIPRSLTKLDVNNTNLRYLPILSEFKNLMTLNVSGCEIEEIELTFMPEHVTIIYNGNTKFLVDGKEFSGEKWNGITIQRIENSKKHIGQHV
ncbi:leucine-rich repeat-containing protein [Candidatus Regiella insecticola LSR1]|uniref:Leucine-rich repeat-containing protein n=1 Tax=Candidatus Regiella insecticola LSR1 TaxID=663321 RepID=E0WTH8_9ENTR|nr:leucine-rich repeat domain-containing protein [Candidatus Regiella insecticola]EFL91863.1 leucine-rich repeat-containing protein [Candidatus Regiella insecticola LSR1]